jgi:hypothetical protein
VYLLLFAASVPWYLPANQKPAIWLGLPYWVVISLASTIAIALFTAYVIHRFWADEPPPDQGVEER